MTVTFKKRFRHRTTTISRQRILDTYCGRWRIVESKITLGQGDHRYSGRWYAIAVDDDGRDKFISVHRTQSAAQCAVDRVSKSTNMEGEK